MELELVTLLSYTYHHIKGLFGNLVEHGACDAIFTLLCVLVARHVGSEERRL